MCILLRIYQLMRLRIIYEYIMDRYICVNIYSHSTTYWCIYRMKLRDTLALNIFVLILKKDKFHPHRILPERTNTKENLANSQRQEGGPRSPT